MQKKLIALAIAGLAAAPAFAQSNVTIYGRLDYGFMSRGGDNGALGDIETKTEIAPGLQAGSRLGFKGAEDLGNGLKAIFEMEFGSIALDTNSGIGGTRHAYVGLTGNFGTVVGGRLDGVRYGVFNKYDPFAGGNMGNFTQVTDQVDRADNAVAYISPSFNGLTATVAYSSQVAGQENVANDGDLRLNTLMLAYDNGPISANLDAERVYQQGTDLEIQVYTLGAAYDFGVVKLSALYDIYKVDTATADDVNDVRSWFVAAKAPVGQNIVLKAIYGRTKDKEDNAFAGNTIGLGEIDARKWGIGADYLLSKRTNFYASYGNIRNKDASSVQISPAANSDGGGLGVRGFDIGIAHKF